MIFINCTPHVVRVLASGSDTEVALEVPPSGHRPQVTQQMGEAEMVESVPVRTCIRGGVSGLPEPVEGTLYIVASMIRDALPERTDLVSPDTSRDGAVRGPDGQPWATRWLIR